MCVGDMCSNMANMAAAALFHPTTNNLFPVSTNRLMASVSKGTSQITDLMTLQRTYQQNTMDHFKPTFYTSGNHARY